MPTEEGWAGRTCAGRDGGMAVEAPEKREGWSVNKEWNRSRGEANPSALVVEPERGASHQEQRLHVFGFDFVRNMLFLAFNKGLFILPLGLDW